MIFKVVFSFISFLVFFSITGNAFAITNPLKVPNNKVGIHILSPDEVNSASKLVNTNGGDNGYVTITIPSNDKDLEKWQWFLDECRRLHVIPIIRIATESNYFNTAVWRKPIDYDIVDFANFLNSLNWPYENRYIIVYNEVNRGDEWGGALNPDEYAKILSYAVTVFKSKSPNFFMISAGMDNASPNLSTQYMNHYNYLQLMNTSVPGIFNQIDGLSSHSYPNPGFSQNPLINTPMSINSFQYEKALVRTMSAKDLPIFITETGWSTEAIPEGIAAEYYTKAFTTTWSDPAIVAVTPFILQAVGGPFQKFSLLRDGTILTPQYTAIKNLRKVKGMPKISKNVLSARTSKTIEGRKVLDYSKNNLEERTASVSAPLRKTLKWLLKI